MRFSRLVNTIPVDHSNETNFDSEPSIAVNPSNVGEMAVVTFTPAEGGNPNAPVFVSTDRGETWSLVFAVPGGEPHDQSLAFGRTSGELYLAALRGDVGDLTVLRSANPSTNPLDQMERQSPVDQPWVEATTVIGGPDNGKDRLYVGFNANQSGRSAKVHVCLDARATSPSFNPITLDPRSPSPNDSYEIRPTIHNDGTVYIAYKSRRMPTPSSPTSSWHATTSGVRVDLRLPVCRTQVMARQVDWLPPTSRSVTA
jgi:hypothetical protein